MKKAKEFHVVIAAAGQGERFGGPIPKQYRLLGGHPLLRYAIEAFLKMDGVKSVRVVISPGHEHLYKDAVGDLNLPAPVMGAATRMGSVYNALKAMKLEPGETVLVHDAARPFLPELSQLIDAMNDNDAATLALPVSDTLRRGDEIVDRNGLWALQTPQAFKYDVLKKAHESVKGDFTDDTGLVSAMGIPVKMVMGSKTNIKLTVPEDFDIAERYLGGETRTGMGYDVHAFSDDPDRKLMICGIHVEHARGLEGHSDADVGLHALTDAILGAIGKGDIGLHFPPSNPKYKNMDSRVFLEEAARMVKGTILNADVTIICEAPKIGPYREKMQQKIAEILKIDVSRVNVKATTTEGLGFTGRGEGIAAQAIATVRLI